MPLSVTVEQLERIPCQCQSCETIEDAVKTPAAPIADSRDLGWMLHDLDFTDTTDPKPRFFRAELKQGVLHIPDADSEEVRG